MAGVALSRLQETIHPLGAMDIIARAITSMVMSVLVGPPLANNLASGPGSNTPALFMLAGFPRTSHTGNPVSEKNSSRKLTDQAHLPTPRYLIRMRVYECKFPRMSFLETVRKVLDAPAT